jgi:anti-anti-sigma factor
MAMPRPPAYDGSPVTYASDACSDRRFPDPDLLLAFRLFREPIEREHGMVMVQSTSYRLRGEVDLENAAAIEVDLLRYARRNGAGPLTVDCGDLGFIDSTGIGALLRVQEALETEGRDLRLVKLPPVARRVVEILDLTETLGVSDPD